MSSEKMSHRRHWNTIRFRLTLWGAGITTGICLFVCLIVYAGLSWSLHREVDGILEGEIQELTARVFEEFGRDYQAAERGIALELGHRVRGDLSYRLLDDRGAELLSYDPEEQLRASAPRRLRAGAEGEKPVFETVNDPKLAYPVRMCTRKFTGQDGRAYTAQAGYLLDGVSRSLRTFTGVCASALAVAGIVAFWGGRIVAGRSLRPVQIIIGKAERITAEGLNQRIPLSGTGDELDRLAETLNAMLSRIEHYVARLKQFTADASHELRSPLAGLRGNAEVALSAARSEGELRAVIQESIEQYDRLGRIAEDLLLLARADAGGLSLERTIVELDKAISSVIDLYQPLAEDEGVELKFTCSEPVRVDADDARMRQLVGNLLDNAIKYSGRGKRVLVAATAENGAAAITVADDGPGIPPEHLSQVFDRFYRVDRSRSRQGTPGAGLGLAICHTIVEAHGGSIHIDSAPGKGTRVTARIPQDCSAGDSR